MADKKEVKKKDLKAYGDTRGTGGYWRDPVTGLMSKLGADGKPVKRVDVLHINSDESRMFGKDIIDVDEGWGEGADQGSDSESKKKESENAQPPATTNRYRNRREDDQEDVPRNYKYMNRGRDPGPRTASPLRVNGESMTKDYDEKEFRNFYGWVTDGNMKNINEAEEVLFKPTVKQKTG